MSQSNFSERAVKKICPNGHCFDDDELNYCPECGLPLKIFDSLQANNNVNEQRYHSQNDAVQYQQCEISNPLQSQDSSSHNSTAKRHPSGVALFFAIIIAFLTAFILFELTGVTHLIPAWHKKEISVEIIVGQVDVADNERLSQWTQTLHVGENSVWCREAPTGYRLLNPEYIPVTVDDYGNPSLTEIWFGYERIKESIQTDNLVYESPAVESHWFTVNIEVYDSEEYFYVGNLTVDLPEGHVNLEDYLPKRYVFNGEQSSFHSVVPSSVNIDSNGDMDTGDIAVHYAHNY